MSKLLALTATFAVLLAGSAHADPNINLQLTPTEAAALQDALDARARAPISTTADFWSVEDKLGRALAADPDAKRIWESAYAGIVAAPSQKGARR